MSFLALGEKSFPPFDISHFDISHFAIEFWFIVRFLQGVESMKLLKNVFKKNFVLFIKTFSKLYLTLLQSFFQSAYKSFLKLFWAFLKFL